ncbi:hypothetical protein HYW83_06520 [Candidatus Peregrinibacteria bacterium]|nr:hypothetical protein [Candidatus Peregrinibacteria bacterium]
MKRILIPIITIVLIFTGISTVFSFHDSKISRRKFAKLIHFEKSLSRSNNPITLTEAAVLLTRSYGLDVLPTESTNDPWYKPYLLALEEHNAIPISFWTPNDFVTYKEAVDMIERLENGDVSKPSMPFEVLNAQQSPYQSTELLRIAGDFSEPLPGSILTPAILRLFDEPATYNIFDVDYNDKDVSTNYCHRFYTQSGIRGDLAVVSDNKNVTITIQAISTDYCVYPFKDMEPGTCPPDAKHGDDPRCNYGKTRPYILTLEKKGNKLFVKGAESNRIMITKTSLQPLCRQWAAVCPGFYNYTKVETNGEFGLTTASDGSVWNTYRTRWQPIFADLRGVPFIKFEKKLENGAFWKKTFEGPEHNRDSWGHGIATYDACMADPAEASIFPGTDFIFCIKREGNSFVIASKEELGDKATLWIDENFRR